jgi:hypothetical protein
VRLLVCGSRDWTDRATLERVLDDVVTDVEHHFYERPTIVQGEARGADSLAREWAESRGLRVEGFPADWSRGKGAGFARNRAMLESGIDGVVAFSTSWPATPGTAHMCRLAYEVGLVVTFVTPDGRERHFHDERHSTRQARLPGLA